MPEQGIEPAVCCKQQNGNRAFGKGKVSTAQKIGDDDKSCHITQTAEDSSDPICFGSFHLRIPPDRSFFYDTIKFSVQARYDSRFLGKAFHIAEKFLIENAELSVITFFPGLISSIVVHNSSVIANPVNSEFLFLWKVQIF